MDPYKALGLDGHSAYFYQEYWYVVGDEVCNVILSFLNHNIDIEVLAFLVWL